MFHIRHRGRGWTVGNDSSNRNGLTLAPAGQRGIVAGEKFVDEFSDQIGGRLLEAREQAGLTVDDVQFQTRIPKSVVIALEAGNFSIFASPTYAKSFLAQYSEFLNVEAAPWLEALQPASFISGENVTPLWAAATGPEIEVRGRGQVQPSGWFPALGLLAMTAGLVFAAVKGYEFLEQRLGAEVRVEGVIEGEQDTREPASAPVTAPTEPVPLAAQDPGGERPQPTPRAIIVR